MVSLGESVKRSNCCNAPIKTEGSFIHGYYDVCCACGKGRWPNGVDHHWEYIPSEYEQLLTDRITKLENIIKKHFPEHIESEEVK